MADFGAGFATVWETDGSADLDPYFRVITGVDVVRHAVARRFITTTGHLPWAPEAGFDLRALVNEGFAANELAALKARIRNEAEQDSRVDSATVDASVEGTRLRIEIVCQTGAGPFALVLALTTSGIEMLTQ